MGSAELDSKLYWCGFLIGFHEGYTFPDLNKDDDTAAESREAAAEVAGELCEPPQPIFPAEAGEESAKA